MELNKKKSLLTPAAPTVWGMIHGDIDKQTDIVEMIDNIKTELITEVNLLLADAMGQTQPVLVTGKNIKSLKGRSLLGAGDIDPLDAGDRALLQKVDMKADVTSVYTKRQVDDLVSNIEVDTTNLATKEELTDLREGEIQTALIKSDAAQNIAATVNNKVTDLETSVNEQFSTVNEQFASIESQIGAIDTMTDDILA